MRYFSHSSPPSSGTGGAFSWNNTSVLSTSVIIDYQNVHLTGLKLFGLKLEEHQHYIDPLSFSESLIAERNSRIRPGYELASLSKVLVFRGLPSSLHNPKQYARNLSQAAYWQRDSRVEVIHRAMRYEFKRDQRGNQVLDSRGLAIPIRKQEKGIDVLCALALVKEANANDLVILASQDTDLLPAIEEAVQLRKGKVETCSWYLKGNHSSRELKSDLNPVWNTRLNELNFSGSLDLNKY